MKSWNAAIFALSACSPHAASTGVPTSSPRGHASDLSETPIPRRPVATYSIVARDPKTGEIGVAVQSHWFSVGSIVTWAEAGVGAVATQSFAEPAYGPRGLALMKSGIGSKAALAALVSADSGEGVRQVAFVNSKGEVAAHTGSKCIESAGHRVGNGYSVQANMMANDRVVPAMARGFKQARGKLPERLLAALKAAQRAGGDVRGKQSAAILVVKGRSSGKVWDDRVVELRIEDHAEPIVELERLLILHRAYEHMNDGDVAVEKKNMAAALRHYRAASRLAPNNIEMVYWHAVTLATNGKVKQSLPLFRRAFAANASWIKLTERLHKPGIIPNTAKGKALVKRIIRGAAPTKTAPR